MTRDRIVFAALVTVLSALTLIWLRTPTEHYAPVPDAGQVRWVSLDLYPMQLPGTVPQPLVSDNPAEATAIAWLASQLAAAPITFGSLDGLSALHNTPALTFGLMGGDRLYLLPALDCQHVVLGTTCKQAANHVLLSDVSRRWRLHSRELSAWLAAGWHAYFRLGDYADRNAIIDSR